MEACTSSSLLPWAGWITSIILGLGGYFFTLFGWRIRGNQARSLAKQKDIHDAIDQVIKALSEFEDAAYAYWSDSNSEVRIDQLMLLHKRCLTRLKQLEHLRQFQMPLLDIGEMRRQATLDAESAPRPLKPASIRLRKLSKAIDNILQSQPLKKS